MAIETRDYGKVYPDGSVELQGRLPKAKPRGCSLTVEEYMPSPQHLKGTVLYTGSSALSIEKRKHLLQTLRGLKNHIMAPYAQGLSEENAQWGLEQSLQALNLEGLDTVLQGQSTYPKTISIVFSTPDLVYK